MGTIKKYALGCAFTIHDLFLNFPYKKLKLKCSDCKKITNDNHRDKLVKSIFKEAVSLVLNDVIDNNVTFQLPLTGRVKADIHMRKVQGSDFKNLRRAGKWKDVDILKSMFTGYQLGLFMYGNRTPRVKNIYVNKEMNNKIVENTNQGKQYC